MKKINKNQEIENRKAFNFLRSYYDVLDEIHNDTDKLKYLMAILDKQFKGIEPELNGISKLCYVGQKHSIDASRKGWEDKVGYEPPTHTIDPILTIPPTHRVDPSVQEQEQEKEEEKEKVKEQVKVKEINKNLILEDERFYNQNIIEIHHIMDTLGITKLEAIEQHKEFLQHMSSVFK